VPTPPTPSNQRTIIQYLVKKSDIGTFKEVQPTSPGEFRWPEEPDTPTTGTPTSEFATPGGQSPETVEGGSVDEADTEPTWSREATSDILARINTYKYVRIVDLEEPASDDLTERQDEGGSTNKHYTVLSERSSDTQGLNEQPRDVTVGQEDTARFDWRVDLKDNSYKYDSLVEPCLVESERQAATRDLRCWSDDDRAAPGQTPRESTPWRGRIDCPVSHHNLWDREEVQLQCDTPGMQVTVGPGATSRRECMMGGGERITEIPPQRPITRACEPNDERAMRYYTIRVDKLGQGTAATQSHDSVEEISTTH